MADGDLMELSAHWQTSGEHQIVNTFGFQQVGATAGDPLATLASDFLANAVPTYKVPVSSSLSLYKILVQDVKPGVAASYELPVSPAQSGSTTGDMLPMQSAPVISLRTTLKGRSYRGRLYMPPCGESNQAGGILTAGVIAAYEDFTDAMYGRYITNAATSHFRWGIISRFADKVERPTPIITQVFTTNVRTSICTQRRRRVGVGA